MTRLYARALGRRRRLICIMLAAIVAVFVTVTVVEATTTGWACGLNNGRCDSLTKYARGKFRYTIISGNGADTSWRFEKRWYEGSLGGISYPKEQWQLRWGGDFEYDDGLWVRIHKYGSSKWYKNPDPWDGSTINDDRTVIGMQGISWLAVFRHYQCSRQTGGSCVYSYHYPETENSVFN